MKTPSTKDTIGCATEVKQPLVPKIPFRFVLSGTLYTLDEGAWNWNKRL
jgi:hypothetical protein